MFGRKAWFRFFGCDSSAFIDRFSAACSDFETKCVLAVAPSSLYPSHNDNHSRSLDLGLPCSVSCSITLALQECE